MKILALTILIVVIIIIYCMLNLSGKLSYEEEKMKIEEVFKKMN